MLIRCQVIRRFTKQKQTNKLKKNSMDGEGRIEGAQRIFQGNENTLHDTIMTDMSHICLNS